MSEKDVKKRRLALEEIAYSADAPPEARMKALAELRDLDPPRKSRDIEISEEELNAYDDQRVGLLAAAMFELVDGQLHADDSSVAFFEEFTGGHYGLSDFPKTRELFEEELKLRLERRLAEHPEVQRVNAEIERRAQELALEIYAARGVEAAERFAGASRSAQDEPGGTGEGDESSQPSDAPTTPQVPDGIDLNAGWPKRRQLPWWDRRNWT